MINLDHVHSQHKTVIYFVQTFGNIYAPINVRPAGGEAGQGGGI